MKRNTQRLLCLIALLALTASTLMSCTPIGNGDDPTDTPTHTPESPSEPPVQEDTTEEVTTLAPLEWESYDPALDDSAVDVSDSHQVNPGQWIAQDGLDRVLPTYEQVGPQKDDKIVAIFYWTWHGDFANQQTAYNNQQNIDKLLSMGKTERDYMTLSVPELKKLGIQTAMGPYHFWDEPIYGYYDGDDEWVIRKQAELLAAAGVDVVFFDNTNGTYTWKETALSVMKVFSEARAQGVDTPDVSFMLPFAPNQAAGTQMVELYRDIYAQGLYKEVWFELDGKPMLMGWPDALNTQNAALAAEIREFFTFRANVGGYTDTETAPNQWGWLSRYPQAYFHNDRGELEQITVGTAVNHNYVDSVIAPMSLGENVIGRTWTSRGYDTRENALLYGACFAEQWEHALAVDPRIVFVTAWNEWVAMRISHWPAQPVSYDNCFVDQYNAEFSRDCEPSAGILKDHYYYQLSDYIRRFKGTEPIPAASSPKLIDVTGGYGQWDNVTPVYNDYFGLPDRDFAGYRDPETGKPLHYTNRTGRNDIYDAKVARDYENVYFMVRTVEDLTPYTDAYWMRLYLDMGESDQNWENYEFILNKHTPQSDTTATLERFTGNGFETEVVGSVTYSVKGNVLTVCIPKTMLGIPAEQTDFTFGFKWADNTQEDGDIMQWYVNGDTAPVGRYNYCYSTVGSGEYTPEQTEQSPVIDFTDSAQVEQIKSAMIASAEGLEYAFAADGLKLSSTGGAAEFVLDLFSFHPPIVSNRYTTVEITYIVKDGATDKMHFSLSASKATLAGAKVLSLTPDGQEHTVTVSLAELGIKGYVRQLGFYINKKADAGEGFTITSVRFIGDSRE